MMKRLSKALAAAGVASRRGAEKLIFLRKVKVNGKVVVKPQSLVSFSTDEIEVDEKRIGGEEKKVCYLLNKPKGYLCTNVRPGKGKIVIDLFDDTCRLFTVGRLDKDTTGLLLVTNDGLLVQKIIHPSADIEKEYVAKANVEIKIDHLKKLSLGANIEGRWIQPVRVSKVRGNTFKIIVKEGKKHEVRILAEKAGLKLLTLKRIRIGTLTLGRLPIGAYRILKSKEIEKFLNAPFP